MKAKLIFQFTHFCGSMVGEVTSQRLLSIKIRSMRIKFYGQSGNGNRSLRWKGMIEKLQLSKKNLFTYFLSE